jgi:hypothetical protein
MTIELIAAEIVALVNDSQGDSRLNQSEVVATLIRHNLKAMLPEEPLEAYQRGFQDGAKATMTFVSRECRRQTERLNHLNLPMK